MRTKARIKVNLDTQIEINNKYCGYCRFCDAGLSRCILFDKELKEEIVDVSACALPIIFDSYRCEECIRSEVKNGKNKG